MKAQRKDRNEPLRVYRVEKFGFDLYDKISQAVGPTSFSVTNLGNPSVFSKDEFRYVPIALGQWLVRDSRGCLNVWNHEEFIQKIRLIEEVED